MGNGMMCLVPKPERSMPQFTPAAREINDIELLRMGALDSSIGFGGANDVVTIHVPAAVAHRAREAGELELADPEGVPLAILTIEDSFDLTSGHVGLAGPIRPLPGVIHRAFGSRYVPPSATKGSLDPHVLTVPVSAPLTLHDLATIRAKASGHPTLFIAMTGIGTPQGLSAHGLVRATIVAAESVEASIVIATPIAARKNADGDQEFRERVISAYAPGNSIIWPEGVGDRPTEVDHVVESDRPTGPRQGLVVFFTGLSGSGKSTIAQALRDRLLEDGVRSVTLLDGDRVRRHLSTGLTFSPGDRETNIKRIGWVAAEISRHGGMAICSPIAPYAGTRAVARAMVEEVGGAFVLVHVATPLEECERRDRKGLYAKARRGEIEQFTGISSPYEVPTDADLTVDTTDRGVEEVVGEVLGLLRSRNLIDCDHAGEFKTRARL